MKFEVEDPNNRKSLSLSYVKMLRLCLWTIAAWPGEVFGEKINFLVRCFRIFVAAEVVVIFSGKVYYLYTHHDVISFFTLGHCCITIFMGFVGLVRVILTNLQSFKMITKEFLMSFHLIHFKQADEYYKKVYVFTNKVSHYYTIYMLSLLFIGTTLFNFSTAFYNFKIGAFTGSRFQNSTLEFSVYFAFPGFDPFDWFLPVTFFNIVVSFICTVLFTGNDLLLSLMIFQIIGHIQILRNSLRNIPKPKRQNILEGIDSKRGQVFAVYEMYDAEENKYVHTKLIECVNHHRMIVSFTHKLSDIFGLMLAVNNMFHLFSCCLLLLECSQANIGTFIRFGPLTIFVFGQLIVISCVFEIVGTVSEKIKDNVYDIPWECMDIRNQRTVCIILHRVQTPITVTAMGMIPVGVTTMAAILKTTFTYFTFLKSTQK